MRIETSTGETFEGIDNIKIGGLLLKLIGSGQELPFALTEIQSGSWTATKNGSTPKTITHNCSSRPSIILLDSDFRRVYSAESKPAKTTEVMAFWFIRGVKTVSTASTSFTGGTGSTANTVSTSGGKLAGSIIDVTDKTFTIEFNSSKQEGKGLTYRWYAFCMKTA